MQTKNVAVVSVVFVLFFIHVSHSPTICTPTSQRNIDTVLRDTRVPRQRPGRVGKSAWRVLDHQYSVPPRQHKKTTLSHHFKAYFICLFVCFFFQADLAAFQERFGCEERKVHFFFLASTNPDERDLTGGNAVGEVVHCVAWNQAFWVQRKKMGGGGWGRSQAWLKNGNIKPVVFIYLATLNIAVAPCICC